MSRIALLAVLIYFIILTGVGTLNGTVLSLALPLVVYLLAGLWRGPEKLDLSAERILSSERVKPGEKVTVSLTVTNHGGALGEILIHDPLPVFLEVVEGSNDRLVRLPAHGSISWSYTLQGRRGFHLFHKLEVNAEDGFGLVVKRKSLPTSGQLVVLPPVARIRRIAIRPRQTRVYSGLIPAHQGGAGIEFFGLREYQAGDSPHHINWRASARQGNALFSNEYEQERVADVGIVLDGRSEVNYLKGNLSLFEDSVIAAMSVASALLSESNRVGLLIYGDRARWTSPGYGKRQRERILQSLAMARTGESQNFRSLFIPHRMFPANSQIIIISPLHADDLPVIAQLKVSGYQVMVISPDPVSFEASRLEDRKSLKLSARIARLEREIMLRRLRGFGIQVVNWNTSTPFEQAARTSLSRPVTFLRAMQSGRGGRG
ncbi:MAG: DUF58 domain-containing protein [Chloroflexi bacterium]|nr:DUF58 domain-containing protein [Chloroflexota bacterium]